MRGDNTESTLEEIYQIIKEISISGSKNASYIPELAKVDSDILGISIVDTKGKVINKGDSDKKVAIESISKVFTLAMVLDKRDINYIHRKIGFKQSFYAFNSVIALAMAEGHRINPFVNNGAMATTSLVVNKEGGKAWKKIKENMDNFAGSKLEFSERVYRSEMDNNDHNLGLAYLLNSWGVFYSDVEEAVSVYTKQCSVLVTSEDLATMASCLANKGINPRTGKRVIARDNIKYILSLMLSDGMYQESGEWVIHVGLPAKSGVGGGIMIVAPGKYGIGIVSPPLNKMGNSAKGYLVAKLISKKLRINLLDNCYI